MSGHDVDHDGWATSERRLSNGEEKQTHDNTRTHRTYCVPCSKLEFYPRRVQRNLNCGRPRVLDDARSRHLNKITAYWLEGRRPLCNPIATCPWHASAESHLENRKHFIR
jgi:hypothetical protein